MSDKIFFSLGPVQGFVAQARRTRDLWSGSFLLSYLSGCAINEVIDKGGEIKIPDISDDALLAWIRKPGKRDAPIIGSIPNRFEALVADNPKGVARSAAEVVQSKWKEVAKAVWSEFVADFADNGKETEEIWNRQVENFWEITWVVAPDISAMNSRKNWRISKHLEYEPGDHCTMMGDWQELSGFIRSKESKKQNKQNKFWESLASQPKIGRLNIRENERLCALALVKRLFPVSTMAKDWGIDTKNWPSTPYVAAIPWLKCVIDAAPKEANKFAESVLSAADGAKRKGISMQIGSFRDMHEPFLDLDGNFYFESALIDCKRTPLDGTPESIGNCEEEPEETKKRRKDIKMQLYGLSEKANKSKPVPFYALLLMDGDNMGKLMSDHEDDRESPISHALSLFTKDVREIVRDHDGVTIYAGGDDVLAMLPMPDALKCAKSLSQNYKQHFQKVIPKANATISGGLVFSHYHIPLSTVMREAHYILDDVAKDENGRNSIAVSVLKNSGKYCQWTVTWDRLTDDNGRDRIDDLVFKVQEGSQKQFSKSFFYGMRDDLAILSGDQILEPGSYAELIDGLKPLPLLTAEYMKSRERMVRRDEAEKNRKEAEERVGSLLELSYRAHNIRGIDPTNLSPDAAMLIKFFSQAAEGRIQ